MSIYFVRHGQTDWNLHGKMQGCSDIPLNDTGREQARITKEKLKHIRMDKIYCSPLSRAKETACIINENWNLPVLQDERICERSFGEYEGGLGAHVDFDALWTPSDVPPFVNSEDTISFFQRVENFLDSIMKEAQDKNILVVAHGGVSIPYYCYFHGYENKRLNSIMLANCEISCIDTQKYTLKQRG